MHSLIVFFNFSRPQNFRDSESARVNGKARKSRVYVNQYYKITCNLKHESKYLSMAAYTTPKSSHFKYHQGLQMSAL